MHAASSENFSCTGENLRQGQKILDSKLSKEVGMSKRRTVKNKLIEAFPWMKNWKKSPRDNGLGEQDVEFETNHVDGSHYW